VNSFWLTNTWINNNYFFCIYIYVSALISLVSLEDLHIWKPEKVKIIKKAIDSKRRLPLPRTLHIQKITAKEVDGSEGEI
jgi:hypothetical protein